MSCAASCGLIFDMHTCMNRPLNVSASCNYLLHCILATATCAQVDSAAGGYSLPFGSDTEIKSDTADNSMDVAVCSDFILLTVLLHLHLL